MGIINTIKNFLTIQDWKLLTAGFVMVLIAIVMIYLISLIVLSFRRRREAVDVRLPEIDNSGNMKSEHKFKENNDFEIQLVDYEDDIGETQDLGINENLFIKALSMETKRYISTNKDEVDMPEVGEIDYKGIKLKLENEAREREKDKSERLRQIAKADEEDFLDVGIIKDGGVAND